MPPGSSDLNPDLQAGSPLVINPTIVHPDEALTIGWLTCDNRNLDTDDFHDAVWIDGNQVDVEPQNRLFRANDNGSFTVSDGLSLGHHQIIVYLDEFNEVDESNEQQLPGVGPLRQ